jgi:hypothetical protein
MKLGLTAVESKDRLFFVAGTAFTLTPSFIAVKIAAQDHILGVANGRRAPEKMLLAEHQDPS